MSKLCLGLIGTGVAARLLYLPAFLRLRRKLELVACTNRTRKKAETYAKLAGIGQVVDSPEALLALPDVEAVLLSLPIDCQPALVKQALALGKPVLSEKPVAPSLAVGKRLLKTVKGYSAPWLVGENFAFMPAVARLEHWLKQGRLGEPRLLEVTQITAMNRTNPYFRTAWRKQPGHVGGFVSDGGVHLAHVVRRLLGAPTVVKNMTAQFDPQLPPIDTAVAALRFASGALGTWTSCFSAHFQGPMLRLYGSKGTAELGWNSALLRSAAGKETHFKAKVDSFEAEFSHFYDVVKKGTALAYTPEDALADLEIIQSIVR